MSHRTLLRAAAFALGFASLGHAQNCAGSSVGTVPLTDMGSALYQGFSGGLYGNGQNQPPGAHLAAGMAQAALVQPLDASGNPSPSGRIVMASIGMSNATQEFSVWLPVSGSDPQRNPALAVVDAAQSGQHAILASNPNASYWDFVDEQISSAGFTNAQVQVVWLKQATGTPSGGFPGSAQELQGYLTSIVQIAKSKFPNLRLCYLSSRTYGGYSVISLNPEPYAYESGFAVQWLIADQIAGNPALNYDPSHGPVTAPWLAWGPYLWADGDQPRSDGLQWFCKDFLGDGIHPGIGGRSKVADLLDRHFRSDPTAAGWYQGTSSPRASVIPYGAGCSGLLGNAGYEVLGAPTLGNSEFLMGVSGLQAGVNAFLFFATAPSQLPFQGCIFSVDPARIAVTVPTMTNALGRAWLPLPIPNDPALSGGEAYTQWFALDPGGPHLAAIGGAAMSMAAILRVGLP